MIEYQTVTGRMVTIKKMTGEEERQLLRASKGSSGNSRASKKKQRENSAASIRALIDSLVIESEPPIDHSTMLLGEETDLLYLIRLTSLGNLYEFRCRCPDDECGKITEYTVDIRALRRDILECSDDHCACHDTRKYDIDELIDQEVLTADFSDVDPHHYEENPVVLSYELPIDGCKVIGRLSKTHYKDNLGAWTDSEDDRIITKSLAQVVESIDGVSDRDGKIKRIGALCSLDRIWLRDQLQKAEPGIDTELEMCCPKCGTEFPANVEIGSNFFLPKRVLLEPWFVKLLRYQREIGKSLTSWVSHSTNAESSLKNTKNT